MKCLSVSQPFAELIITGKKTIELRKWNTNFRGEFLIHAPLKIRNEDCKRLKINHKPVTGAIVGKAELYDVKKYNSEKEVKEDQKFHLASKKFYNRAYGFMLKKPKIFRVPIPWKGQLGFFEVDLPKTVVKSKEIVSDIIDEEYRYQWINHH
ncbi:ASCH domain-containing protein [Nitrosopumilus sp. K4]|uniref:ASCH domain-containing protein n=1 Tax=Nitrosopumilus sp. K4 TaxID=2795383 RepID=UPI001BADD1F0|nr:ASCH domain-containing protein [Nitrosopumilus sp. K4]QUC64839.1 ASCH domain-containing protein [Nitrosopumilus sp. K4]